MINLANTFKITGIEETVKNLNKTIGVITDAKRKAIMTVALDLKGESQNRAPIEFGVLRESARAIPIKDGAEVSFGGRASAYALRQHEDLTFRHPQGGEAKYLERPLQENLTKYINMIKNGIEDVTR